MSAGPMIQLSDRLQRMARRVPEGDRAADIGTDHGQLPVYLCERGISPFVVMTDVSGASLDKAKATAGAFQFGEQVSFRLGDGLQVLSPGEVDTVIIAGMGGKLIRDILDRDPVRTNSFKTFILQPRTAAGALRKWLLEANFRILAEDIVREGRFLPEIITAARSENNASCGADLAADHRGVLEGLAEDDIRYRVPPWITRACGPVNEYLKRRIDQERRVLAGLKKAAASDEDKIKKTAENISYLEGLAKEIKL